MDTLSIPSEIRSILLFISLFTIIFSVFSGVLYLSLLFTKKEIISELPHEMCPECYDHHSVQRSREYISNDGKRGIETFQIPCPRCNLRDKTGYLTARDREAKSYQKYFSNDELRELGERPPM
jgi:hypothetical protein